MRSLRLGVRKKVRHPVNGEAVSVARAHGEAFI